MVCSRSKLFNLFWTWRLEPAALLHHTQAQTSQVIRLWAQVWCNHVFCWQKWTYWWFLKFWRMIKKKYRNHVICRLLWWCWKPALSVKYWGAVYFFSRFFPNSSQRTSYHSNGKFHCCIWCSSPNFWCHRCRGTAVPVLTGSAGTSALVCSFILFIFSSAQSSLLTRFFFCIVSFSRCFRHFSSSQWRLKATVTFQFT